MLNQINVKERNRKKYKLKQTPKKLILTFIVLVVDIILYHFLGKLGYLAGKNNLASTFIYVGWFWLLAGQFMALYFMWDN